MHRSTRNDRFKRRVLVQPFVFFYGYAGNFVPPFLFNGVSLFILFFMVALKIIGNRGTVGAAKFLFKY